MKVSKFDIAEYLDNKEMVQEYLNNVLEEGNSNEIVTGGNTGIGLETTPPPNCPTNKPG